MAKPESRDVVRRHARLEPAFTEALQWRTFFLENLDEPPQHHHQRLAGSKLKNGRNESRIQNKISSGAAPDTRNRQQLHPLSILAIEHQTDVLPSELQRFFVAAGVLVRNEFSYGNVARMAVASGVKR